MKGAEIFTERAHLMCPNMCFGIAICINKELNENKIADTVKRLSAAHPFLRALISHEEQGNRFFYDVKEDLFPQLDSPPLFRYNYSYVQTNEKIQAAD